MLKRFFIKRLEKRVDVAVKLGAMSQDEGDEVKRRAIGMDWVAIIELIKMILDMISQFLNRNAAEVDALIEAGVELKA